MSDTVISVENVSKQYNLGVIGTGTFRNDLKVWWARVRNKPNPLQIVNEVDHGNRKGEVLWALKDISFKVQQGEALGIIGRNGAGKSTLLKILSRVTTPTSGEIKIKGRIASLLEVGTGFHPELTGRENIFLNGAIMGMSRQEVTRKFDEIVDFSGVEQFIDTPVKRYSSGMYVRLAFAVAAHLEPEILIVDEVLAVGDAEFQKKCLGKMGDVAHEGRTVLFVSHNIGSIMELCERTILLEKGKVNNEGCTKDVVFRYLNLFQQQSTISNNSFIGSLLDYIEIQEIVINDKMNENGAIHPWEEINIRVRGLCRQEIPDFRTTFSIFRENVRLITTHDLEKPKTLPKGKFESQITIPPFFLRPGNYSVAIGGYRNESSDSIWGTDLVLFQIVEEWGEKYEKPNYGWINFNNYGSRISN